MTRAAVPLPKNEESCATALVAASILAANFAALGEDCCRILHLGADWLHVDVMDGHFAPNLTMGLPILASLRKATTAFLDVHLCVTAPEAWVDEFSKAGADMFTFHLESLAGTFPVPSLHPVSAVERVISRVRRAGMHVGIAISPQTAVEALLPYANKIDMALVMTVEPGFGGQTYMPSAAEKCRVLRSHAPLLHVQVDGGISLATIDHAASCGANVAVAGTAIFGSERPGDVIRGIRAALETGHTASRIVSRSDITSDAC